MNNIMPWRHLRLILRHFARSVLNLFLPPRCPVTGALVSENGTIDPALWGQLSFIQKPFCSCCGDPFANDVTGDFLCASCMNDTPDFDRARAVMRYDEFSAKMILKFKHADGTVLAPIFARWMMGAGEILLSECDMIVPVPLHRFRLWKRRYNQAALLSAALSKKTGVLHAPLILTRTRRTESQGHKSKADRATNMRGAFAVPVAFADMLKGKRVLLVDDVFTSGATVNACARALRDAGVKHVDVLCVARVSKTI